MITVVRKLRGGAGRMRASSVLVPGRISSPSFALRLKSNSTSSLPFAGRFA